MRWTTSTALCAALVFGGFCFDSAHAAETVANCKVPSVLTDLEQTLPNTTAHIAAGDPIKIIAIGSSSTAGAGASTPAASYPSRLEAELTQQFPGAQITVLNRGINGQESADMLARLKTDVIDERPTLVIWQLGTNSVLRDHPVDQVDSNLDTGIALIKEANADVILIDPQFVPRVIAKPEAYNVVKLISADAKRHKVGIFHRFAVMRYWHETAAMPFETFTSPDGLHMNDWSYGCWAKLLSASIAQSVSRPTLSARVRPTGGRTPGE
jgi:acyl-CoA thioesterase-1